MITSAIPRQVWDSSCARHKMKHLEAAFRAQRSSNHSAIRESGATRTFAVLGLHCCWPTRISIKRILGTLRIRNSPKAHIASMPARNVLPLDGGCACGVVRYRMVKQPLFVHCCHCRWCQRESGASFALNAMIEADYVIHWARSRRSSTRLLTAGRDRRSRAAKNAKWPYGATIRVRALS